MLGAGEIHHRDGPHAEVGAHRVGDDTIAREAGSRLVQERIIQRPETRVRQGELEAGASRATTDALRGGRRARDVRDGDAKRQIARGWLGESCVDDGDATTQVGGEVHGRQRRTAPRLEVDGLPDPARLSVPLLSLELERVWTVVDAQDDALRRARSRTSRKLDREGDVASLVLTDLRAVQPHGGAPVRRADDEKHSTPPPLLWDRDRARVPPDLRAVRNAGKR